MNKWEYLRVSVYHKTDGNIDFVAKKDKTASSIATHDGMEAYFNVTTNEWVTYLQKLREAGWKQETAEKRDNGQSESYAFKRSKT